MFVLGIQRSGTTWLANILAQHTATVAVQAEDHFGIHESIFFSHFARAYGDLADDGNFARFAADFTTSDYYLLTGLEPVWLAQRRPRTYAEAFRVVMDEMAAREGARLWIEKSPHHTLLADELEADFPDARFVCITRNPEAVVASTLRMDDPRPPAYPARLGRVMKLAAKCSLYQGWLEEFCRTRASCALIRFERLASDPEAEVRRICKFLELDFTETMLDLPWKRNTSYAPESRRRRLVDPWEEGVTRGVAASTRPLPLMWRRERELRRLKERGIEWPEWCWRRRDRDAETPKPMPAQAADAPRTDPHRSEATARG